MSSSTDEPSGSWDCDKCTFVNSADSLTCEMCYQVRSSTRDLPYTWQWLAQVDWIPYDAPSNDQIESAYQSLLSGSSDAKNVIPLNKGWFAHKRGEYSIKFHQIKERPREASGEDSTHTPSKAAFTFTQLNNFSGMIRKVRRLANDDQQLFQVIPPSATQRGEKCSICAEEWWEEEEEVDAEAKRDAIKPSESVGSSSASTDESTKSEPAAAAAAVVSSSSVSSSSSSATPSSSTCLSLYPDDSWPDAELANMKLRNCHSGHSFHRHCIAAWIKLKDECAYCKKKIG